MNPAIVGENLWKHYDGQQGSAQAALRGANLRIEAGQVVALYGRSGSGKTTLLNLIAGLDRPSKGKIVICGQDLEKVGEAGRTRLRRQRIGFVFQFFNLLPTLTAFENVHLSLELAGSPDRQKALKALAEVGLEGKEDRFPYQLSGGEQQRVAIARAMVKEPELVLADEPTGSLDTLTGDLVLELLSKSCRESGATLIMATHSPRSSRLCDRILRMVDGQIVEDRPPRQGAPMESL